LAVTGQDVREVTIVRVERRPFLFEVHPSIGEQRPQTLLRFLPERRCGIQSTPDFRRDDPEQPHAAVRGYVNRIPVHDRLHEHRLRSGDTRRCG